MRKLNAIFEGGSVENIRITEDDNTRITEDDNIRITGEVSGNQAQSILIADPTYTRFTSSAYTKILSNWTDVNSIYVKYNNAWVEPNTIYKKINNVWKRVY